MGETGAVTTENGRPEPPVTSASIVVLALARRVENELNAALADLDLTVRKLGLLGHVGRMPGVSFSELARMAGVSVQSVHTSVKALTAAGLVRDSTAKAGAASTIELTAAGTRLLAEARRVVGEVDERLFGAEADPVRRKLGAAIRHAFETGGIG
ncbi:MarR family transcriptional regulator [Nocardia farcinica]|nr:MarR family transcriptional regulator [Nocardia farcinica]MBF6140413.1 MarR family transcriptional regulator [Nocardia farcinica]MBF6231734.1 MarR family transcriptional regulator [Nocardia farcinica]MBF6295243.1 MarR family transcriptional regulator [Nocardia farcinica]MBF6375743.1 MarR family transcriptional regulator [Nocardia farcinica]